ncbi:NUDIX domain protein [Legionella massiliensis]|uniref:NUDIX domain protein n=1 Tax=Legionella massiliensis TaxID=1034943 RepID=A0A078L600_9GAMM|nr:NUDIX hydrolase [Legionella massiliensis]CDZ79368.1 NUDIX domain protein [Legionella massiliensis]CEE15106.1 NUDIX domain protein [Legionella massiliensis]
MLSKSEQLKVEREACTLLDRLPITMFGARIHNPDGPKRKSYDIHPYTKQGSGVSCTITYTDDETGVIQVLHARKPNKVNYEQIGGYTRGQGPAGSEVNFDTRSEDQRDQEEEALIGNLNAITLTDEKASDKRTSSYSLKQLQENSYKGFLQQQGEKLGKKINPLVMKKYLADAGINYTNDYNAWETALREAQEETGLNLMEHKPRELYTSDDFGVTNEERLHTKVTHYLFHLGRLKEPPTTKAGSDIAEVKWAPVHAINLKKNDLEGMPLRESYLLQTLPRAIKKVRELELKKVSNKIFLSYESIGEKMDLDPYSFEAHEHHQKVLTKAQLLSPQVAELISKFDSAKLDSSIKLGS